jgi:hypothetical protein
VVDGRCVGVGQDFDRALDRSEGAGARGGAFGGVSQFDPDSVLGDGDRRDGEFVVVQG